jgi:hypothetical protein
VHWSPAFKPGDNLFPKDKDGKNEVSMSNGIANPEPERDL